MTKLNINIFAHAIAHVAFGMNQTDFRAIFGPDSGDYQWDKFANYYNRDAARWVNYLDLGNRRLLGEYLDRWVSTNSRNDQ